MPIHHGKGAVDPAGKGQPHLLEFGHELFDHGCQRRPVHKPHLANLFSQRGLHMIGKR